MPLRPIPTVSPDLFRDVADDAAADRRAAATPEGLEPKWLDAIDAATD